VRSDWKVRSGTVNRTVNMIVTPRVKVNTAELFCLLASVFTGSL
jgi:hypothetical protein